MLLNTPAFNKEIARKQFVYTAFNLFNRFVESHGNDVLFDNKPKFKMKATAFVTEIGENS